MRACLNVIQTVCMCSTYIVLQWRTCVLCEFVSYLEHAGMSACCNVCPRVRVCVCVYIYIYIYMYVCICMCICMYVCMYVCVCMHVRMYVCVYACMFTCQENLVAHIESSQ
jgi:hypothetical protein